MRQYMQSTNSPRFDSRTDTILRNRSHSSINESSNHEKLAQLSEIALNNNLTETITKKTTTTKTSKNKLSTSATVNLLRHNRNLIANSDEKVRDYLNRLDKQTKQTCSAVTKQRQAQFCSPCLARAYILKPLLSLINFKHFRKTKQKRPLLLVLGLAASSACLILLLYFMNYFSNFFLIVIIFK